jgi:hypothetical protein
LSTNTSDKLEISGSKKEIVKIFKYLCSVVKDKGSADDEVEKGIRQVISVLKSVLWSRNFLQETEKLIHKTVVKRILLMKQKLGH